MTDLVNLEECERVAIELARQAGKMIKDTWGKVASSVEEKECYSDLVTETDKKVEAFIFQALAKAFPSYPLIGEETVSSSLSAKVNLTDKPTWIVDPVDGTMNFVHTFPFVAVCIGLAVNKEPVLGVVFCPALDMMFTARQGNGAFCNGKPISVRHSTSLKDSLVCTELGGSREEAKRQCIFASMEKIGWQSHGMRSLGSAAMNICAVASGWVNAYYEWGLHCWDMCAPVTILVEAGGFLCDTTGGPFNLLKRRLCVASNKTIADELVASIPIQFDQSSD